MFNNPVSVVVEVVRAMQGGSSVDPTPTPPSPDPTPSPVANAVTFLGSFVMFDGSQVTFSG